MLLCCFREYQIKIQLSLKFKKPINFFHCSYKICNCRKRSENGGMFCKLSEVKNQLFFFSFLTHTPYTYGVKYLKSRPRQTSDDHVIHSWHKDLPVWSLYNLFSKPATNRCLLETPRYPSCSCKGFLGLKSEPILLQFKHIFYCLTLHRQAEEILLYVPLKTDLSCP